MPASLHDPDWWFTLFLGLIVISLVWSYVRDAGAAVVGRFIPAVRRQRDARALRERKQVDLFAANPELLIMELVRCLYLVVLFLTLVGFYLFFSIIGTALHRATGAPEAGLYDLGLIAEVSLIVGAFLGLCSIYFGTPITPRLHTVMRARAEYENRCKRLASQGAANTPRPTAPTPSPARPAPPGTESS